MLKRFVVVLTVLFSLYGIAYAQTFNVSTTAQLRTAFDNASVNGEDDTIILEAGTYKTTDDGVGTFKFSDTEAHNLTIQAQTGLAATDVILDGANTHQVLNLTNTKTVTFTLERVTIKNGKTSLTGGGIYTNTGLTVTNSTISGNTASISGGGIRGYGTFINNIFDNNSSDIFFTDNSYVYNNYIDYAKLQNESSYAIIKKNNIQPSSGSLNFADSSFRLGAGSVAIDKGLDPNSTTFTNLFTSSTTLQTVQTALLTDKDGSTRIIGSAIDLGAYEYNGASTVNNCAATLSDSFVLQEPYFTINGSFLWLDLQYAQDAQFPSTDLMFKLSNAGGVTTPADYSNCQASALSVGGNNYVLHIPILILGGTSYWLDLAYVPTPDGLLWFKLTGIDKN